MSTTGALTLLEQGIGSHALQHNGLASHAQEWQRELDRAQARAWFHVAPTPPGHVEADGMQESAVEVAAAPCHSRVAAIPLAAHGTSAAGAARLQGSGAPAAAATPTGVVSHPSRSAMPSPDQALPAGAAAPVRSATAGASREAPVPPLRRTADPAPASPELPVRVHVESDGDGVRVWIGLAAGEAAASARAAALLPQLRRALEAEGHRLLALTCNGRLVEEAASPSTTTEQSTWRSER